MDGTDQFEIYPYSGGYAWRLRGATGTIIAYSPPEVAWPNKAAAEAAVRAACATIVALAVDFEATGTVVAASPPIWYEPVVMEPAS
jgi:hypothetical protein